jgi:hypothetical protein
MNAARRQSDLEHPVCAGIPIVEEVAIISPESNDPAFALEPRFEKVENSERAYRRESLRSKTAIATDPGAKPEPVEAVHFLP